MLSTIALQPLFLEHLLGYSRRRGSASSRRLAALPSPSAWSSLQPLITLDRATLARS